ncbi:MAG: hypothetical protein IMZ62_13525 [Chloroflexi bacterium]|nr:hypothetical protein [Chloroflexota bacterium]
MTEKATTVDISTVGQRSIPATLNFFEEPIVFRFKLGFMSMGETDEEIVLNAITEWDITDGGKPVPITKEAIAGIPDILKSHIVAEMIRTSRPNLSRSQD